jgi:transposase-like protein
MARKVPPWAMSAQTVRAISTGDFQEALCAILGADAPNVSPNVMTRLTGEWQQEYDRWQRRDLSARRYVYIWADGVYLQARMDPPSPRRTGPRRRTTASLGWP